MSVKVPIRTVFDGSTATGLAEYQSGEFIGLTHGGTGASLSIGSAGQDLKVNSGASALEFGNVEAILNIDGMTDGSGITIVDGDDFAISDAGTEKKVNASQLKTYMGISAGGFALTNLDIDGGTDIGEALVDADLFIVDNGAGGTNRKTAVSRLKTYIGGGIDCDADSWARVAPVTDQDSAGVIDWATSIHMGSNISESAGVITVGTAGWYLVTFHISNQSAYSDNMNMYLRKNDTRVLGTIYWEGNTEINYLGMEATVLVECSANDTLDVYGTGYYTGNTNNQSATWFTGVRLGA